MCLAIPAQVENLENEMARCRVGESETFIDVCTMLLDPQPSTGDWLIVHAGFAMRVMDPREAQESLDVLRQMAESMGEEVRF